MKGLMGWMVGVSLTLSLVAAPVVSAECNDSDARSSAYSPTGYWPANQTVAVVGAPMTMSNGMRVYFVSDDPAYDLSGSGDFWYLVNDGTAFHATSYRSTAAYVRMNTANHEVVMIPAEYRQDWLAVAAGDRPVRCLASPRSVMDVDMNAAPAALVYNTPGVGTQYSTTRYADTGTRYRAQHPRRKAMVHRRTHTARYSAARRVHHRHRVAAVSHRRRTTAASYSYAERTTRYEPAVVAAAPAVEVEVKADMPGHDVFQCNDSWYRMDDGMWSRAESWRGPFVHIKKGMVPREVRMSAKHRSRIDMD
jgi:hypothetical protein